MNEDLISRKALIKEFAVRARAARNWKESAINNGNDESAIRADAILSFLTEVKLTIENAPNVLPKSHGRLIDADAVIDNGINKGFCNWYDEIKSAPTIIEAEEEAENVN